jgi:hypothetical protein
MKIIFKLHWLSGNTLRTQSNGFLDPLDQIRMMRILYSEPWSIQVGSRTLRLVGSLGEIAKQRSWTILNSHCKSKVLPIQSLSKQVDDLVNSGNQGRNRAEAKKGSYFFFRKREDEGCGISIF